MRLWLMSDVMMSDMRIALADFFCYASCRARATHMTPFQAWGLCPHLASGGLSGLHKRATNFITCAARLSQVSCLAPSLTTHHSLLTPHHSRHYSVLKLFTGFAIAALMARKLTVTIVNSNAPMPAAAKIHHDIFDL